MSSEKKTKLLGICGVYCGACTTYRAYNDNDRELLNKEERQGIPRDEIYCSGCTSDLVNEWCSNCYFRECATERRITYCFECEDFPCKRLVDFSKTRPHRTLGLMNHKQIRETSIQEWLGHQEKRWTCRSCGKKLHWYSRKCPDCGADFVDAAQEAASASTAQRSRMRIEAVLFDLFDTLLLLESDENFYPPSLRRLHESLSKNGVETSFEDFKRVYFEVREKLYCETKRTLEDPHFNVRVSQTLQRLGYDFDVSDPIVIEATMAFADELTRHVRLDEEAIDVLQKLHGNYKLGLVSNFGIPECAWKLLEEFGLKRYFDTVVISGEVNRRKPSPEIFKKALKLLNAEASTAVFVGDTPSLDVIGPKNVGMKAILIIRRPMEENIQFKPDRTITRLKELITTIEDL